MVLRRGQVDLAGLAPECVEGARLAAAAHGVALSADVDADAVVDGDAGRLARLLDNLVRNAIAATPAGGSVVVSSGRGSAGGWLAVADDGPGIPETDQARLFEPYVRGTHGGESGAGLGLAIARAVAEAHGATVSLESAEGLETIIVVEGLPLAPGVAEPAARR